MKHVEACLSARDDRESNFHRCGSPVRLVQACLCAGNLIKQFSPPRRCCEARAGLSKCQGRSRKHFTPLLRPCEVGAILFMCGKD